VACECVRRPGKFKGRNTDGVRMMDIGADTLSIIGIVISVGIALAVLILRFHSEASADRRAFQSGMDDFRREMQRLAERQSSVEGRMSAGD